MAETSKIEWTDATWSPITGCSVVSPGCANCYAMRLAGTRLQHHPSRAGLTQPSKAGPVWTGEVRLNEDWLAQPLRWTRPRRIFVCAHGDLFHEAVPDAWIDKVFAIMALAPQHTFQVLTKRSARMRAYITGLHERPRYLQLDKDWLVWSPYEGGWPTYVWLGVSAEDQPRADERIPDLLATPAAVRFLSAEPLLGPIDLASPLREALLDNLVAGRPTTVLDWVIVGGENGPRPMHPDWARRIRDDCAATGTAFFMKQMARRAPIPADLMVREYPNA